MRNLFNSKREQGSQFLNFLQGKIDTGEFSLLQTEGGFTVPNDYLPIEAIMEILSNRAFPEKDFYEFEWAIYGCEYDYLRDRYSIWMQLLIASLYVYCNKRKVWGITIDSDYHYLIISSILAQSQNNELALWYLSFLEWLHDQIEPDIGYDNYYCFLTWALLRRLTGSTDHSCFQKVVDILIEKNYSTNMIEELTVSDRGIDAWDRLHKRIPRPTRRLRKHFNQIIRGIPSDS